MLPVRTNHLMLVDAIQVVAGGAFAWSVVAPSPVMFAQAADTSTAADPGGSNGDEVPNTSQRPASAGGDEVPTALAPANPEPSSEAAQSATSSSGDEVPSSAVVPDAVGALPSKSSAGGPGEETLTSPANQPAPAAPAAAPPPAIAGVDDPIADRLREALKGDTPRVALEPFYSARNYAPLWITDGKVNERARAAMAYLAGVDADGLDPADYSVPDLASLTDAAALAGAEIKLSVAATNYAHHAEVGRVHWTRVSGDILYELKASAPADVLANLASADDITGALAAYEPQAPPRSGPQRTRQCAVSATGRTIPIPFQKRIRIVLSKQKN